MIAVRAGSLAHLKMAIRCREDGDLEESLRMLKTIVETRINKSGKDNNETAMALSQLGRTYLAMGEFDKAYELHQSVYKNRKTLLGLAHQHTLNSAAILMETLFSCEKFQELDNMILDILIRGASSLEDSVLLHPASKGDVDIAVKLILSIREKCKNDRIEQRVLSCFQIDKEHLIKDLMRLVSDGMNRKPIIQEEIQEDLHTVVKPKRVIFPSLSPPEKWEP